MNSHSINLQKFCNMPTLYKEFSKFKGMDLDCEYLKRATISMKFRRDFTYQDCLTRNAITMKTIYRYRKDFERFTRRTSLR